MFSSRSFDISVLRRFLLLDFLVIAVHVAFGFAVLSGNYAAWPDIFNIGRDWSAGEILNYAKWVLLLVVLVRYYRQGSDNVALALIVLFAISFLDDSLRLHEAGGDFFVAWWGAAAENENVISFAGEFLVWCLLGSIVAGFLFKAWRRTSYVQWARAMPSIALFALVVFCAIVLDFVHTLRPERSLGAGLLGLLEDGGEMIALTLLVAHVNLQYRTYRSDERNAPRVPADGLTRHQP